MKLQTLITTLCAGLAAGFAPALLGANGTPYYLDLNGSAPGFGDLNGTTNLSSAVWSTNATGATAPGPQANGSQLTFGYPETAGISNNVITINCDVANGFGGLALNVPCSVTLSGTANTYIGVDNTTWTVTEGATFTMNVLGRGAGSGLNYNNVRLNLEGGGTINFATALYNVHGKLFTQNGPTVNLLCAGFAAYPGDVNYMLNAGRLNFANAAGANFFNQLTNVNSITINGGTIDNTSGSAMTVNVGKGTYAFAGDFTFAGSSSLDLGAASVSLSAPTITVVSNTLTIGGVIDGGGLTKAGAGTLLLTNASPGIFGPMTVTDGTLILSGSAAINGSSGIAIDGAGARLVQASGTPLTPPLALTLGTLDGTGALDSVTVADNPGCVITAGIGGPGSLTISNLTFNGAGALNVSPGAKVAVANTLTTGSGAVTVNASSGGGWAENSTNILVTYANLAGSGTSAFVLGTVADLTPRQNASLVFLPGAVALRIAGGDVVAWTGAQGGNWTANAVGGLQNWKLQTVGTPVEFLTGDKVMFDDGAVGGTTVTIADADVAPTGTVFSNNSKAYVLSGSYGIAAGALTVGGSGTVTLVTSNSYSKGTTIRAGTLQLGDGTTKNGYVQGNTVNDGTLAFANPLAQSFGGVISGSGSVVKSGPGTLTLSGTSTYSGGTRLSVGTVSLANGGGLGSGLVDFTGNAVLQWNGITTDLSPRLKLEDGVTATLDTMGNTVTLGTALQVGVAKTGALTKTGTGTLTLNANPANSYTGNTTVRAGTLIAGSGTGGVTGVGSASAIYLGDTAGSANATLQLGVSSSTTFYNPITVQSGNSGVMVLNGLGNITLSNTVTLGLEGGSGKSLSLTDTGSSSFNFILYGSIQDPVGMTPGTAGTVTIGTVAGAGAVRFGAANTYSGDTRVAFSTLGLNHALALQNSTLDMNAANSGSVSFVTSNIYTLGGLKGSRNVALGASSLSVGNNNQTTLYSGALSGTGGLAKIGSGVLTLAGTNTYAGATTVATGTLVLSGGGSIGNSANISVAGGALLDASGVSATFTLQALQTLSGNGAVTGSVGTVSGATLSPASVGVAGTLALANNLNLSSGAHAWFDVSTSAASGNDQITVGGNLTVNSNVIVHVRAFTTDNLDTNAEYVLFQVAGTTTLAAPPFLIFEGALAANAGHYLLKLSGNNLVLQYGSLAAPAVSASVAPTTVLRNQSVTVSATVAKGSSNIVSVAVDLSGLGGSAAQAMTTSDGTNYSYVATVPADTSAGAVILRVTVIDDSTPTPLQGNSIPAIAVITSKEIWNGLAANDNWSANNNWQSTYPPGWFGDTLEFGGTTRLTPNMDHAYSVNSVTFAPAAGSFTIGGTGGTLTLAGAGGGVTNNSTSPQTLNVPLALSVAQTMNTAAGDLTLGGAVSGSGSLTKRGTNTLSLNASNTYTGGTIIPVGGTVSLGNLNAAGTSGIIDIAATSRLRWNGVVGSMVAPVKIQDGVAATLDTTTNTSVTLPTALQWGAAKSGTLTKTGAGALTLSGSNNYAGTTTVAGGTLTYSSQSHTLGTVTVSGGSAGATLNVNSPISMAGKNLTVGNASGDISVVNISSNATVNSLAVGNPAGSAGALYLRGGTVTRTPTSEPFAVDGYGYLNISGGSLVGPPLWQSGQGGTHTNGLGIVTQTGGTVIFNQNQPFVLGGVNNAGGTGVFNLDGGSLTINNVLSVGFDTTTTGHGEFNISGGSVTATEARFRGATIGIYNLWGGILAVNSVNSSSGLQNGNAAGSVNFHGGTLKALQGGNLINLTAALQTRNNVFIFSGGATIDSGAYNVSIVDNVNAPSASGVASIALTGGGAGYIGEPFVQITGGDGFFASARAQINPASGTVTNILITNPGFGYSLEPTAILVGGGCSIPATLGAVTLATNVGGGLTKIGAGTLTMPGANSYTGATVVSNGTLKVSGEIGGSGVTVRSNATLGGAGIIYANVTTLPGGLIAPGGLSTLIVNGNLTSAGGFAIELNRYAYPNSSGLVVSGTLTQTGPGTLTVSNAGVELVEGDTFQLFNGSALIGGSALTITPAPGAGLVWSNSLAVDGSIVAVAAPANITYSVSGGQITLAWPDKYLGWNLQAQTNQLNVGLSTNWVAIPGTETVTSTNLPVDPANPAVFYRLRSP